MSSEAEVLNVIKLAFTVFSNKKSIICVDKPILRSLKSFTCWVSEINFMASTRDKSGYYIDSYTAEVTSGMLIFLKNKATDELFKEAMIQFNLESMFSSCKIKVA